MFKSISAFSPIVAPSQVPWGQKAFAGYLGDDKAEWLKHDACALMKGFGKRGDYPEILIDQGAADNFFEEQKGILQTWHEQDPANEDEINRTWAISEYQEDKPNPFILDNTLIERAYFYDGFVQGDINEDGVLNILDIVALVSEILSGGDNPLGDLNGDENVNILDVVILADIILN